MEQHTSLIQNAPGKAVPVCRVHTPGVSVCWVHTHAVLLSVTRVVTKKSVASMSHYC